jgi:Ni,Fe-hydrogenase maturation factor
VPTPAGFVCPLPSLPDLHNECPKLTPQLQDYVETAIQKVIREHPEVFDLTDDLGGGAYKVRDRERYHALVIDAVHAQGVCGIVEKEEVAVKTSNAFNEQYNIWTSGGYVRHGPRSYITTCFPAQF